jgi:hypothetical protein
MSGHENSLNFAAYDDPVGIADFVRAES